MTVMSDHMQAFVRFMEMQAMEFVPDEEWRSAADQLRKAFGDIATMLDEGADLSKDDRFVAASALRAHARAIPRTMPGTGARGRPKKWAIGDGLLLIAALTTTSAKAKGWTRDKAIEYVRNLYDVPYETVESQLKKKERELKTGHL